MMAQLRFGKMDIKATVCYLLVWIQMALCSTVTPSKELGDDLKKNMTQTKALLDTLLSETDPRIRPNVMGEPVVVTCNMYIVSFGSISEVNMDYSMDIMLRQSWMDSRVEYDPDVLTKSSAKALVLTPTAMEKMWVPDVYFPLVKKASLHTVTVPNKLMRIYPNGTVIYSLRLTLTMACPMDLRHFPMDHQECFFVMESYGHETADITLQWSEKPVDMPDDLDLPQFTLLGDPQTADECESHYTTGDFPCLKIKFALKRQYGFYLLQTYVPSILIVILSWVSFWINIEAVPARISLGVTTVLTMTTQLSGSKASIPRVSYPKAIDVWMAICMMFVFTALVEYAIVNSLYRSFKIEKYQRSMRRREIREGKRDPDPMDMDLDEDDIKQPPKLCPNLTDGKRVAKLIDRVCRWIFPSLYFAFNIVYWSVYTRQRIF